MIKVLRKIKMKALKKFKRRKNQRMVLFFSSHQEKSFKNVKKTQILMKTKKVMTSMNYLSQLLSQ